jgi:hypothetical protein
VAALAAVARRDELSTGGAPLRDDPVDRRRGQRGAVGEDDHGRLDLGSEHREAATKRGARPALPVRAVDRTFERVRARDDDDLVEPLDALEDRGEEQSLLGRAEPRRCSGSEDDGADHQLSSTVTFWITTGCDGGPSPVPSASIALTVSMPSVTVPTTA